MVLARSSPHLKQESFEKDENLSVANRLFDGDKINIYANVFSSLAQEIQRASQCHIFNSTFNIFLNISIVSLYKPIQ